MGELYLGLRRRLDAGDRIPILFDHADASFIALAGTLGRNQSRYPLDRCFSRSPTQRMPISSTASRAIPRGPSRPESSKTIRSTMQTRTRPTQQSMTPRMSRPISQPSPLCTLAWNRSRIPPTAALLLPCSLTCGCEVREIFNSRHARKKARSQSKAFSAKRLYLGLNASN